MHSIHNMHVTVASIRTCVYAYYELVCIRSYEEHIMHNMHNTTLEYAYDLYE